MKALIISLCFMASFTVADYSGTWVYSIDTPDATYDGSIVLEKADGEYTGKLQNDDGFSTEAKDLKIEGDKITFSFYFEGFKVNIKGTFKENKLNASVNAEGMQFPFVAVKKA